MDVWKTAKLIVDVCPGGSVGRTLVSQSSDWNSSPSKTIIGQNDLQQVSYHNTLDLFGSGHTINKISENHFTQARNKTPPPTSSKLNCLHRDMRRVTHVQVPCSSRWPVLRYCQSTLSKQSNQQTNKQSFRNSVAKSTGKFCSMLFSMLYCGVICRYVVAIWHVNVLCWVQWPLNSSHAIILSMFKIVLGWFRCWLFMVGDAPLLCTCCYVALQRPLSKVLTQNFLQVCS